jgi:hypothetical protein
MSSESDYIKTAAKVIAPTMEAILAGRVDDFTDDTYDQFESLIGSDVTSFIVAYQGGNGFLNDLKKKLGNGTGLSLRQKRAAANIIRRALRDEDLSNSHGYRKGAAGARNYRNSQPVPLPAPSPSTPPTQAPDPVLLQRGMLFDTKQEALDAMSGTSLRVWECYKCHKWMLGTWDDLVSHKATHAAQERESNYGADSKNQREVQNAFVRTQPTLNLDVRSAFPAKARFAVRQADGTCIFFIKTTLPRRTKFTGRFNWSKYPNHRWGWYLNPGDVTIRKQSGDTREFVGMQATDDPFYFGELEALIAEAMKDPMEAMMLYGKEIGACCYCGRSLTDADSKKLGIGPDCFEQKYVPWLRAQNAKV